MNKERVPVDVTTLAFRSVAFGMAIRDTGNISGVESYTDAYIQALSHERTDLYRYYLPAIVNDSVGQNGFFAFSIGVAIGYDLVKASKKLAGNVKGISEFFSQLESQPVGNDCVEQKYAAVKKLLNKIDSPLLRQYSRRFSREDQYAYVIGAKAVINAY